MCGYGISDLGGGGEGCRSRICTVTNNHKLLHKALSAISLLCYDIITPTGTEVLTGSSKLIHDVPILGLYQSPHPTGGRIAIFGDSNCLDNSHMRKSMY